MTLLAKRGLTIPTKNPPGFCALIALAQSLACCASPEPSNVEDSRATLTRPGSEYDRVPPFARRPYEPFSRESAVAIALREWRVFGQPVDDSPPLEGPPPEDDAANPARQPGLWQRVGEYWWIGVSPESRASSWTGKHDSSGSEFPPGSRGAFPWSAAFISYVMRIAGAGDRFPYSQSHATYIAAGVRRNGYAVVGHPIDGYAPQLGDIICAGRDKGKRVHYVQLPRSFPAHCEIVVSISAGQLSAVSGNVGAAVTLTHVPILPDGRLGAVSDQPIDDRYPWIIVLQVLYDK